MSFCSLIPRYTNYGLDKLNTPEHRELALVAAREGIVLLENREHYLPTVLAKHKWEYDYEYDEDDENNVDKKNHCVE